MPDVILRSVRAADSPRCLAFEVERIFFAQRETACILINFIIRCHITKIRNRHQARCSRIIHQAVIAEAISFIGINRPEFRMAIYPVQLNPMVDLELQFLKLRKEVHIPEHPFSKFLHLT
ncbi:hypothetical protein D3C77_584280 [compost metagenome]